MFFLRQIAALGVIVASLAAVPAALADGDPASDYLITQPSFVPFGNGTTTAKAKELAALLVDAKQQGFPLKVAVIASAYDLGSVPGLFRQPAKYVSFLGQEDFYYFKDELLVVMPNGYGLFKAKTGVSPADKATLAALPIPNTKNGDELIDAAIRAVKALGAQRGLSLAPAAQAGSDENHDRIEIVAAVLGVAVLALLIRLGIRRRRRHAVG